MVHDGAHGRQTIDRETGAVSIRRARPQDAAALATFAARCFSHTYEAYNTPEDMRSYLASAFGMEQQATELADPAMVTVLAEEHGGLVGYAQLRRKAAPACVTHEAPVEIYRFYVDASVHGKGVAQELMAEAMAAARDLGGRHLWLGVWERNPRAIAFYMKSGFIDVGKQIFELGNDRQTDRVLVKPL
jgi:ribosomal protein S18 acetylase RimI-like enzyme